jgi:hypothetical protein
MLGDSSLFLLCLNVLVYTHVSVGVFTRTPFFPIQSGGFNSSEVGATVDAWPYLPGFKVGQM